MISLCYDLFLTLAHCSTCGVYFRWLSQDSFVISNSGRLVMIGFDGATFASASTTLASTTSKQVDKIMSQVPKERIYSSGTSSSSAIVASLSAAKRAKHEAAVVSATASALAAVSKLATGSLPAQYLDTIAPEIVFGGPASENSSVYSAAILSCYLFTGKPPIKVCLSSVCEITVHMQCNLLL